MNALWILLVVTFVESLATILVERGAYFFTQQQLGFSPAANLWMAFAFGLAYAAGAVISHPIARRHGERAVLVGTLAARVGLLTLLGLIWGQAWAVVVLLTLLGLLSGAKWPIIESYVSAGRAPESVGRAIGRFNVSWALAVPISMFLAGPLIASSKPWLLFALPAGLTVVSILLCIPMPSRPAHLAVNDPQRPPEMQLRRMRSLLTGSRWMHLCSYGMMWVLAALMPTVYERLEVQRQFSSGLAGVLDFCRLGVFILLQAWAGWHFRLRYLTIAMAALPLGFALVLYGPNLALVLAGEALFGVAAGMVYYSALYYGMVVSNAAVEGGGTHEGLIGAGFALGPACALAGMLMPGLGSAAVLAGVGTMFVACLSGALVHLRRAGTSRRAAGS